MFSAKKIKTKSSQNIFDEGFYEKKGQHISRKQIGKTIIFLFFLMEKIGGGKSKPLHNIFYNGVMITE